MWLLLVFVEMLLDVADMLRGLGWSSVSSKAEEHANRRVRLSCVRRWERKQNINRRLCNCPHWEISRPSCVRHGPQISLVASRALLVLDSFHRDQQERGWHPCSRGQENAAT